jgi:DNA-binding response OmpR family regulator
MASATVLYIRNPRRRDDALIEALDRDHTVRRAGSGKEALALLDEITPDVIVLDAASLNTGGGRICRKLKAALPKAPLIHIPMDAKTASDADVILSEPTPRRLTNSVGRFLTHRDEEVLNAGPFSMNVPRRILLAHGRETQLTPKQARLVELFLRHPGQTLDRKTIMERVWETTYLGDTRTLDVHIRWIRRVIENGSKKPRYLKTVRGVGYKLDVAER